MNNLFRHIKNFLKENVSSYLIGVILLLIVDGFSMITPLILGDFTDTLSSGNLTSHDIYKFMLYIMGIATIVAAGRFGWRMFIIRTSKKLEFYVRNKVFRHFEKMSQNYFNNHKTGDLMAHCTNDISMIRMAFGGGTIMIIDSIFLTVITIALMITKINLRLTLIALLPLPLIAIMVLLLSKVMRERFKALQEAFSSMSEVVQEAFSGIRIIKSFIQEEKELEKFNTWNQNNFDKSMNLIKLQGFVFPMVGLISMISIIIGLLYGGKLVINDVISIGNLVSFISYIGMLTWPMIALGFVFHRLQQGRVSLERINKILDTEPEIVDADLVNQSLTADIVKPAITIKNLNFTYQNTSTEVLKNINLSIQPGETLAIIGKTGAGKTTLINLLLRLYNVESGSIFIDGHDINEVPIKTLRDLIGYVPQDNFLFSKSIRENVSFADETIPFEKLVKATKVSKVYDEIMSFNDDFKTELGERGVNMSGGQKQRVSIARALAKDPSIIILDDSLSAVDTKTEETILNHLSDELHDKTAIIIAHRISTIKNADKIIVLDHGEIIESGTHNELISNESLYFELYQKQLLEEKIQKGGSDE